MRLVAQLTSRLPVINRRSSTCPQFGCGEETNDKTARDDGIDVAVVLDRGSTMNQSPATERNIAKRGAAIERANRWTVAHCRTEGWMT
jgi:hypothetical protein